MPSVRHFAVYVVRNSVGYRLCTNQRPIELVPQRTPDQLSLFVDHNRLQKKEKLENAVELIRSRFGKRAIAYALLMGDVKMPDDGRHSVKMPGMMYQ